MLVEQSQQMFVKIKRLLINFKKLKFRPMSNRRFIFVCIVAALIFLWIKLKKDLNSSQKHSLNVSSSPIKKQREVSEQDDFQVVLDHCKIPHARLKSEAYRRTTNKRLHPELEKCDRVQEFSTLRDNVLKITDEKAEDCCVKAIERPFILPSDGFRYGRGCKPFASASRTMDVSNLEFIQVQCYIRARLGRKRVYNLHANFPLTGVVKRKHDYWTNLQASEDTPTPANILVLVIGSTSRTNVFRSLPQTMKFIKEKMNFIDFKGHHPLGEPSLVNMMAMLTGIQSKDFWGVYKPYQKAFWDSVPLIWDIYNRLNYITGYFEDLPPIGTFNWGGQRGFVKRPTDLLTRPIMMAHTKLFPFNSKSLCFGHRRVLEFILDHIFVALQRLPQVPKFLVSTLMWPNVEIEGSLSIQDEVYANFFKTLWRDSSILENTVIIITSDNGFWKGTYAKIHEGLIERRNIPLFIRLSNKISRQNQSLVNNLLDNTEGVTSHFDVYQTLFDIAKMVGMEEKAEQVSTNGKSLLDKISFRTCGDALIPQTMCSCNLPVPDDDILEILGDQTKVYPLLINK